MVMVMLQESVVVVGCVHDWEVLLVMGVFQGEELSAKGSVEAWGLHALPVLWGDLQPTAPEQVEMTRLLRPALALEVAFEVRGMGKGFQRLCHF